MKQQRTSSKNKVRLEPSSKLVVPIGKTEATARPKSARPVPSVKVILRLQRRPLLYHRLTVPRLLVASHIKPWSDFPNDRLNPCNGLCLSSLHDAAFDFGLITLDEDLKVVLSKQLRRHFPEPAQSTKFVLLMSAPPLLHACWSRARSSCAFIAKRFFAVNLSKSLPIDEGFPEN